MPKKSKPMVILGVLFTWLAIWVPVAIFGLCLVAGLVRGDAHLIIVGLIGVAVALFLRWMLQVAARSRAGRR